MGNFRAWVELTRRKNFVVRHENPDGSRHPDYYVDKGDFATIDGKKLVGKNLANALCERVREKYYQGELNATALTTKPLSDLVEEYLDSKKRLAWTTLVGYRTSLEHFVETFGSLNEVTSKKIMAWWDAMKMANAKHNTIHKRLRDSRTFCKWLITNNYLAESPFHGIKIGTVEPPKPRFYETQEFIQLDSESSKLNHYARLAFLLAHDGGLRKVEIVGDGRERLEGVRYEDLTRLPVSKENPYGAVDLWIRPEVTKGKKKGRKVRLSKRLIEALGSWKTGPLVLLTRSQLDALFKKIKRRLSTPGRSLTIHGLRHTFGKNFMQTVGNQPALRDLLGHSDIKTTAIYSQFEPSFLDNCVEKMHQAKAQEEALIKLAGQNDMTPIDLNVQGYPILAKDDNDKASKRDLKIDNIRKFGNPPSI